MRSVTVIRKEGMDCLLKSLGGVGNRSVHLVAFKRKF